MTDDMLVMILGRRAGDFKRTLLSRTDLLGRYAYRWKGASANANKQVLGRQMLDALKVLTTMPPPMISQLNFNGSEFFKILWSDIWNLPDADKILGQAEEMVTQDAEAENKMVKMGLEIEVYPMDDDKAHIPIHDGEIGTTKDPTQKMILMQHVLIHKKNDEQKQMQKQQQQQMQQQQQQLQQLQMQALAVKATPKQPAGRSQGSGNRTQMSPNANAGDIEAECACWFGQPEVPTTITSMLRARVKSPHHSQSRSSRPCTGLRPLEPWVRQVIPTCSFHEPRENAYELRSAIEHTRGLDLLAAEWKRS